MKKILAVSAIIALAACGSDNGPTATRPHFASDITAAACANGKSQATATWQVTGSWKAIFVGLAGKDSSIHVTGAVPATSLGCSFAKGDRVYAILFPYTVQADADLTKTIVIP
jgi:hypothetical protein